MVRIFPLNIQTPPVGAWAHLHREPAENIDHLDGHFTTFFAKAEKEGIDFDAQTVVLLKEAQKDWDADGKLKTGRSAKWKKYGWNTTRSGQLLS